MIIAFCGPLGSGKTLGMTWLGKQWLDAGYTIYSNYHLNFKYKPIIEFEDIENMTEGFALLDELWLWMDARLSSTKKNRAISEILLKSRKRKLSLGYTAQSFRQIDIRLRHVTDYLVMPNMMRRNTWCVMKFFGNPPSSPIMTRRFKTAESFKLYDTREEIGDLVKDDDER